MIKNSVRAVVSSTTRQSARDDRIKKTFVTFDPVLSAYCELSTPFTPSGDFEIEVDVSTTASSSQITIARGSGTDFIAIDISSGNSVRFWATVGGVTQTIITGSSVNDCDLHTIKATYTGTTAELFIDGASQGTATWALDGGQDLTMIGRTPGGSNYFDGIISNIKLTDLATPANSQHYALNRITGNTETSLVNSGSITYNNIPGSDRETFSWDADSGYWVGIEELLSVSPGATWQDNGGGNYEETVSFGSYLLLGGEAGLGYLFSYIDAVGAPQVNNGVTNIAISGSDAVVVAAGTTAPRVQGSDGSSITPASLKRILQVA